MSKLPQFSAPNAPFVGPDGRLTYAANVFLRDLWLRVGGADAPTNGDLEGFADAALLGIFRPRERMQEPADIGHVRTFIPKSVQPQEPASISYVEAFTHRRQEQSTPFADAGSVICSRVFAKR